MRGRGKRTDLQQAPFLQVAPFLQEVEGYDIKQGWRAKGTRVRVMAVASPPRCRCDGCTSVPDCAQCAVDELKNAHNCEISGVFAMHVSPRLARRLTRGELTKLQTFLSWTWLPVYCPQLVYRSLARAHHLTCMFSLAWTRLCFSRFLREAIRFCEVFDALQLWPSFTLSTCVNQRSVSLWCSYVPMCGRVSSLTIITSTFFSPLLPHMRVHAAVVSG